MMRPKKLKSTSVLPTTDTQQQEMWHRLFDCLKPQDQETILSETSAARAAGGSRLAVALHLRIVRRVLCDDATNAKQKKLWSAYLAANLPGFSISRAQVFRDISAAEAANETFPPAFLAEFISGGYALNVRPSIEEPLGKFTKPCKQILAKLKSEELNEKQCQTVLAEAAAKIKAEAKKNRVHTSLPSAQEKRDRILADIHNLVIKRIAWLPDAIEPGDSYTSMNLRDDLELIVNRIMTAAGIDVLEVEPRSLPEGFERLSLSDSAPNSSDDATSEAALAATAA